MNGELVSFLDNNKGLTQTDHISIYLFVIVMAILSDVLTKVANNHSFKFHNKCKGMKINHLSFADDLLPFCKANKAFICLIKHVLNLFYKWVGLKANLVKSNIFFSRVSNKDIKVLMDFMGFQIRSLPIKFLGVPLITTKLKKGDCKSLINKILKGVGSSPMLKELFSRSPY